MLQGDLVECGWGPEYRPGVSLSLFWMKYFMMMAVVSSDEKQDFAYLCANDLAFGQTLNVNQYLKVRRFRSYSQYGGLWILDRYWKPCMIENFDIRAITMKVSYWFVSITDNRAAERKFIKDYIKAANLVWVKLRLVEIPID